MGDVLYHYTSLETLFEIINQIFYDENDHSYFKFRATSVYYLNDKTEGKLIPDALDELEVSENDIHMIQKSIGFPFVVSLTEIGDDLNMWRCYANNGKGVSIGLDKEELNSSIEFYDSCKLDKCDYVSKSELVNILKSKGIIQAVRQNDIKPLAQVILGMEIYKEKSFSSEKEWRIHDSNLETNYRISNNLIIPYREVVIPTTVIKSITIGPLCDYSRNVIPLQSLLKKKIQHFQEIDIRPSSVPLQ